MHFNRPDIKQRLFAPRILLYVALLLIAAWWMNRLDRSGKKASAPTPPSSAELLDAGVESSLPLMVVISLPDEAVREAVAAAQQRHAEKCRIVLLTTGTDTAGVQEVFQVTELPVAVLYNKDNKELARMHGAITDQLLAELADKCPKAE